MIPDQAVARIRALVSGFPGDRGRLRELLMLRAYVDGSGTGDPRFLVIAGYIATVDTWADFSKEWKSRLDCAHMPFFKMNQMAGKPEIAGWFYRTLEEFDIKAAIAVVLNTKELKEVERSIKYPPYITNPNTADNPYYWGFKYITGLLAERQEQLNLREPVDFIFDDEAEKTKIPAAWDALKKAAPPQTARLMGDTPIFRNDKTTMPLQAADLYAWWCFKWQREGVSNWSADLPFPWEKKKQFQILTAYFGRKSFTWDIAMMLQQIARTPEELEYARSIIAEEWEEEKIIPSGRDAAT